MKLENGRELLYLPAYYKRRYVNVPLLHLPEEAITNEGDLVFFRFIPIDNPPKIDPLPMRERKAAKKSAAFAEHTIDPAQLSDKVLKQLCKRNDIPIEWVTDRFSHRKSGYGNYANRRENRKIRSLTSKEFKKNHKELRKLNEQSALIVSILWFLNSSLEKGGGHITLEEILRVKIQDFLPTTENRPAQIHLMRTGRRCHLVSHWLPPRFERSLRRQIKKNSIFVFSNKYGGPVLPGKVDADIKKAGEKVGMKNISSLSMRPQFNKKEVICSTKKYQMAAALNEHLEQVTQQEWEMIRKHVPSIENKRGRKSSYQPRDLLNAVFYHLKTPCPLRKLPSSLPPWQAVDSQYRRWKRKGIIDAIVNLRKAKMTH